MQLTTVQLGSIVITLVLTILPGIYAGRKVKSADDYALVGRSAGIGMVAGSIIGTIVGGAATIGTAQLGFQLGLTAIAQRTGVKKPHNDKPNTRS